VKSAIYRGIVTHARRTPTPHAFTYRLFMMYLDLAELDEVFRGRWLWSTRRPAPAWFRRADYLGDAAIPLDESVRAEAERQTGRRPDGPIRMLTHLRYFGYVQNPVTFYYCFDRADTRVDTILAEITNTPWNERHTYALTSAGGAAGSPDPSLQPDPSLRPGTPLPHEALPPTDRTHRFDKAFHVSPFMEMDHEYAWRFAEPGDTLRVHMENRRNGARVFDASLTLRREEITAGSLATALLRYPWMTGRVALGIYWQALRLWLKRTPFHVHPARKAA
jgi:DUF1365 family protein